MYALASKLSNLPVISLQTGETIAILTRPLIDPGTLELVAYICQTTQAEDSRVLMARDIRQMALDCLIVDSEEELAEIGDIIRVQHLLEQRFTPLGKKVITDLDRHLGRVEDFTVNLESNRLQKIYIKQPFFLAWLGSSLIVDRSQILDVTPHKIIVRDTSVKDTNLATEPVPETRS